ncbi:hypothetical protein BOO69_11940 [Sulfitobacter alexandrii]|uniref:Peptidase C45 hydrolase domain-containing protein n=1 Tax=Sulfitobacter alexandrii TaxID=1917485 RepID=A0A1J0WI93_9RHOB|nr:C45 family peptidase [Sulfitobacter alexandrii]APE44041.1 hypothetical protein BOO69_11940 [Sulfitobacter alexandrii]
MDIVDCFGPPAQRGQAHGETLRTRIASALDKWEAATMASLGARAPESIDRYCDDFLSGTGLLGRAEAVTPDLVTELRGIADGAGQSFARIAVYNLMDEQWWHDASLTSPPGCSLVAQPVAGGHVLAQNMDLPAHMDGSQVILRLGGPDIPRTLLLSAAGMIGLTGANADGLAVGVNTLLMLEHASDGLPVAFALRHALGAGTRAAAEARLAETGHASGQHYALVTRDGIVSLEYSARSGTPVPLPASGRLLHTNHPLASGDIDSAAMKRLHETGANACSGDRLGWLEARQDDIATSAEVRALFDDPEAPICMRAETHRGSITFGSVHYTLTDRTAVAMRQGITGTNDWQVCDFGEAG